MVALNTSSNYELLTQAQQCIEQLNTLEFGNSSLGNNGFWFNSAFDMAGGLTGNIEGLVNGDSDAIQNVIQNLTQKLGSIFRQIGNDSTSEAKDATQQNEQKIQNNEEKAEQANARLEEKLQAIMDKCTANGDAIEEALKKIQDLGGEGNGKIAQVRNTLQGYLDTIEKNKAILNNETSEPKERQKALGAILSAASAINTLVREISQYTSVIEEQQNIVNKNSRELASTSQEAQTTIAQSQQELQTLVQENAQLTKDQTTLAQKGTEKTIQGGAEQAVATAMQTGPQAIVTGAKGAQLETQAFDDMAAGKEYMSGAVNGIKELAASNAEIGKYGQNLAKYQTGLGQYVHGVTNMVGQFDAQVNSMIESIGSWEEVETANNELQEYVQEYTQEMTKLNGNEIPKTGSNSSQVKTPFAEQQTTQNEQNPIQSIVGNVFNTLAGAAASNSRTFVDNDKEDNGYSNPFENADADKLSFKKFEFDTNGFNLK